MFFAVVTHRVKGLSLEALLAFSNLLSEYTETNSIRNTATVSSVLQNVNKK
jgi:hypothetical protein